MVLIKSVAILTMNACVTISVSSNPSSTAIPSTAATGQHLHTNAAATPEKFTDLNEPMNAQHMFPVRVLFSQMIHTQKGVNYLWCAVFWSCDSIISRAELLKFIFQV